MSLAKRLVDAAEAVRELNARIGSGPNASWTAADLDHAAADIASEEHLEGRCPVCLTTVVSNHRANISLHRDQGGLWCPTSGQSFALAVTA